jgi:hypothetical protein
MMMNGFEGNGWGMSGGFSWGLIFGIAILVIVIWIYIK